MNPIRLLYNLEQRLEWHEDRIGELESITTDQGRNLSQITEIGRSLFGSVARRRITMITLVLALACIDIAIDLLGVSRAIRAILGIPI